MYRTANGQPAERVELGNVGKLALGDTELPENLGRCRREIRLKECAYDAQRLGKVVKHSAEARL